MRRISYLLVVSAFSTITIFAATLQPGPADASPDVNFTLTFDASGPTFTLATSAGPDILSVRDGSNNLIGNVIATDQGSPGLVILSVNGALTEAVGFTFNPASANLVGSNLLIDATGAALTAITDPGLAALVGTSTFTFASAGSQQNPFTFDFSSAALPATVPEPAVAFSVGIGLIAISALRLRKKA